MKNILKIFLLVFVFISILDAKEEYLKENITKYLEVLVTKNVKYEKRVA